MPGTLPEPEGYREDFTFAPRHLGTLRFNDAEILTVEELLDEDGYPVHGHFNMTFENSITGDVYSKAVTFTADPT